MAVSPAVHVVGNAGIDTTFRLRRLPRAGETVNASHVSDGIGGKGINQAVAARRTGASVTLWAAIGRDAGGETIRRAMASEGMRLDGLTVLEGATDRSSILVDETGENLIVSDVARARAYDPTRDGTLAGAIATGDIVVLQGNFRSEVTIACLQLAKARGATTVVNASPLTADGMDIAFVDVVVVNAGEAEMLTGHASPEDSAVALLDKGPCDVIVTLGRDGALVGSRRGGASSSAPTPPSVLPDISPSRGEIDPSPTTRPISPLEGEMLAGRGGSGAPRIREAKGIALLHIPAPAVHALDTSGAGDVFCGVVAGSLAAGMSVEAAVRLAVRAAAIAVTRAGTLAACPSAAEIAALRASS